MESQEIFQTITMKTESINEGTFLLLRELFTKYYFQFLSTAEEQDYRSMHILEFKANFSSLKEMFEFNKELEKILI